MNKLPKNRRLLYAESGANIIAIEENMKWSDLSNEAKAIIEWVENPFTDKKETIKIGEIFRRECPMYCGDKGKQTDVNILVTKELYEEILRFVTEDTEIQCEQLADGLLFKLKEDNLNPDWNNEVMIYEHDC